MTNISYLVYLKTTYTKCLSNFRFFCYLTINTCEISRVFSFSAIAKNCHIHTPGGAAAQENVFKKPVPAVLP